MLATESGARRGGEVKRAEQAEMPTAPSGLPVARGFTAYARGKGWVGEGRAGRAGQGNGGKQRRGQITG